MFLDGTGKWSLDPPNGSKESHLCFGKHGKGPHFPPNLRVMVEKRNYRKEKTEYAGTEYEYRIIVEIDNATSQVINLRIEPITK